MFYSIPQRVCPEMCSIISKCCNIRQCDRTANAVPRGVFEVLRGQMLLSDGSLPFHHLCQEPVERRGEALPVGQTELCRTSLDKSARAKLHHQITNGKPLPYILLSIEIASRIERYSAVGNDPGCQRDIRCYHQVLQGRVLCDVIIGHIEPICDDHGIHKISVVFGESLVRNKA